MTFPVGKIKKKKSLLKTGTKCVQNILCLYILKEIKVNKNVAKGTAPVQQKIDGNYKISCRKNVALNFELSEHFTTQLRGFFCVL